jgi:EmrB/QacA subfamily drug resistance transporter
MSVIAQEGRATDTAAASRRATWALFSVCLGYFMVLLDGSALNVALPSIQRDVHGTLATLQWLVNIYTIMLACLLLSMGALADRLGSRKVFMGALGAFALTSLACGLSPDFQTLLAFRALQGVAAAGMLPTTLAIIARTYPDLADRARAITVWGATGGTALVVGPIGGGALTQYLGWRSIFLVNVPVGLFALWLSWRFADETDRREAVSYDPAGQVTIIAGLALVVAGLIEGGERGWGDMFTLILLAAGTVALTVYLMIERRVAAPMLPLAMFRKHAFTAAVSSGFAFQFGAFGLQFVVAIFIEQQWGYSASHAGAFLLPYAVLLTLGTSVLNRWWKDKGMRWLLLVGSSVAIVGTVACVGAGSAHSWPLLMIGFGVTGLGGGILAPSINGAALAEADAQYAGIASGVLNTFRQVGFAVGVAVLGAVLSGGGGVTSFRVDLALGALCFLTVALLSRRYIHR